MTDQDIFCAGAAIADTEAPNTPEMMAFAAFLAASFESGMSGESMREAVSWSLAATNAGEAPVVAPWPDFAGRPIRHGDRLTHPVDGNGFVAVRLAGHALEVDAWRAVYDDGTVSRLALQIGTKGVASVTPPPVTEQRANNEWSADGVVMMLGYLLHKMRDHWQRRWPADGLAYTVNALTVEQIRKDLVERITALEQQHALPAQAELSPRQIERGWRDTFSTENPFCPCDLKSFTKAVHWAERARLKINEKRGA